MNNINDSGPMDFFEQDGRPIAILRQSNTAWGWSRGKWRKEKDVDRIYAEAESLDRNTFVRAHPYAALELLEISLEI